MWVKVQARNKDTLSPERSQRLEEIGFVWSRELPWDEWYGLLIEYKLREGHCSPTKIYKEGDHALGGWVSAQRTTKDTLSPERRQRLDEIGFVWRINTSSTKTWDEWYGMLIEYKLREGHCNVHGKHKEGDHALGTWVSRQRVNKDTLSPEQRQKLDDMGFVWDPYAAAWEEGIAALLLFKKRVGDCMVPFGHKEGQHNLAKWVSQVTPR
jgi:hypothetical protein